MKSVFSLALVLAASSANVALAQMTLVCRGSDLVYGQVKQIVLDNGSVTITHDYGDGQGLRKDVGSLFTLNGDFTNYTTDYGVSVSVSNALADGSEKTGTVHFSTSDYPYESATCTVLN